MKTDIFSSAINRRNKLKFLYGLSEIELEPYYLTKNKTGKKVIYGRVNNSNEVKMFEYDRIFNIKVLNNRFYPIIPILTSLNWKGV